MKTGQTKHRDAGLKCQNSGSSRVGTVCAAAAAVLLCQRRCNPRSSEGFTTLRDKLQHGYAASFLDRCLRVTHRRLLVGKTRLHDSQQCAPVSHCVLKRWCKPQKTLISLFHSWPAYPCCHHVTPGQKRSGALRMRTGNGQAYHNNA